MAPSRTAEMFRTMCDAVEHDGPSLVRRVKSVIKIEVEGAGAWLVDLKTGDGSVKTATAAADVADVTITLSEDTFRKMMDNQLNPQQVHATNGSLCIRPHIQILTWVHLC